MKNEKSNEVGVVVVPQVTSAMQEYGVDDVLHQIKLVQEVMSKIMLPETHYGKIPGCGDKNSLFKAGAEKLCLTFRLSPSFAVDKTDLGDGHYSYDVKCLLTHIITQQVWAEGVGCCSTMESKYRYRDEQKKCPTCGALGTIIKGNKNYGGGWLCWNKKGGCGDKWVDGDRVIEDQKLGKCENPNIADVWNTVLKIAKKRAHVDATINATACSDIFTQDLEDINANINATPASVKTVNESVLFSHECVTTTVTELINESQIMALESEITTRGIVRERFLKAIKVDKLEDIRDDQYKYVLSMARTKPVIK